MGILAAVAIPAYNKYRRNAKATVVQTSINGVASAFSACLAVDNFTTCYTSDINGTLKPQSGSTVTHTKTTTAGSEKACWRFEVDEQNGCVEFNNSASPETIVATTWGIPIGTPCANVPVSENGGIDTCVGTTITPVVAADTCTGGCTITCTAGTISCGTGLTTTAANATYAAGDCI